MRISGKAVEESNPDVAPFSVSHSYESARFQVRTMRLTTVSVSRHAHSVYIQF